MPQPMPSLMPISCVRQSDRPRLDEALESWGADAVALDGSNIVDEATFRSEIGIQWPIPAGLEPHNWSALKDCLHQMFIDRGSTRVAIVWDSVDTLVAADVQGFLSATTLLESLVSTLYRIDEIDLYVFLLGAGEGYRSLDDIDRD